VRVNVCSLLSEGTADYGALAGDDVSWTLVADMNFQVQAKQFDFAQSAGYQAIRACTSLMLLNHMVSN
jgi:hypothetical protein